MQQLTIPVLMTATDQTQHVSSEAPTQMQAGPIQVRLQADEGRLVMLLSNSSNAPTQRVVGAYLLRLMDLSIEWVKELVRA